MKQKIYITFSLGILIMMQSCLISRGTQNDLDKMDQREVYDVRTVRVPMFIARPAAKIHLKNEHASTELRRYINRIKAVRITIAATRPGFDMEALKNMTTKAPYQNWASVKARGNMVYINALEKNNSIRKINVLVAAKDNAMVYVMIKCKLSPDELSRFINLAINEEEGLLGMVDKNRL